MGNSYWYVQTEKYDANLMYGNVFGADGVISGGVRLSEATKLIFDKYDGKYDGTKDGILDDMEMGILKIDIQERQGKDNTLSIKEANEYGWFRQQWFGKNIGKDVNQALTVLYTQQKQLNEIGSYVETFPDGGSRTVYKDGRYDIRRQNRNGSEIISYYSAQNKLVKELIKKPKEAGAKCRDEVTKYYNTGGSLSYLTRDTLENGKWVTYRQEVADPATGRLWLTKKLIHKSGNDGDVVLNYKKDGSWEEITYNMDGKELSRVQKDKSGQVIQSAQSVQITAPPVVTIPPVQTPAPAPTTYEHKVASGDTWYGIVQAKYGIDENKMYTIDGQKIHGVQLIRKIVKELKVQNSVDPMNANMPSKINLQPVTLGSQEFKLIQPDAQADKIHFKIASL